MAFDFNRTYGIELECIMTQGNRQTLAAALNRAGLKHTAVVQSYGEHDTTKWGLTTDNSITGGRMGEGVEIRGPILAGQQGLDEIAKVCRVLEQNELTIHPSCGHHVHIDVRRTVTILPNGALSFTPAPLSINSLRRLAMFYAETEALLDMAQPPSRRGKLGGKGYACSVADIDVAALARAQDASAIGRVLAAVHGRPSKFHKINFDPVAYIQKGTVEFRHHAGTISYEKISNWIWLAQRYVRMAENESDYPISAAQVQHVQSMTRPPRVGSKTHKVYEMLMRSEGATEAELLAATGWTAITVPGMAKKMGLTLRTEQLREGSRLSTYSSRRRKVLRYWGSAVTPALIAQAANIKPKPASWEDLADRLSFTDEEKRFWLRRVQDLAAPTAAAAAPATPAPGAPSTPNPF